MIEAGLAVVNSSGPWFNKLNETVGLKLSTSALPTRIQVGHKWIPDEFCDLPFVADGWGPSGIYFMPRARNNQLVFGSVAHRFESEIVDPDDYNTALDPDVKQDYLGCLFHRLPTLPQEGEIVGFSSMYTVNQDDVHPMIGETHVRRLWACNGFSGHGFKLAPRSALLRAADHRGAHERVGDHGPSRLHGPVPRTAHPQDQDALRLSERAHMPAILRMSLKKTRQILDIRGRALGQSAARSTPLATYTDTVRIRQALIRRDLPLRGNPSGLQVHYSEVQGPVFREDPEVLWGE